MNLKQIPLSLALALAVGALAAGCAVDAPPAPADDPVALEQVDAADPRADAHADEAHGEHHADPHAHDVAHAAGVDFPVPEGHVQWQPDAPLIEGMSRVRTALDGLEQSRDEADVLAHTADVDAAIEYMFENCSLPVEPDIALHAVLARLMAATQALHANPADTAPVQDMRAAVANYEALFNDPNAS